MKPYSITRRLLTAILLMEFVLTGLITTVELLYLRDQHFKTFDIMLRGRADSVSGAVQDAEDEADNVLVDTAALDLPESDLYEVRDESGKLIGRSGNWSGLTEVKNSDHEPVQKIKVDSRDYRGLTLHTVRDIDLNDKGTGLSRKLVIFYAAPTRPVWHALAKEAKLLAMSNSLLLVLSGLAIFFLLKRGMAPLNALTSEASKISAQSWNFRAPPDALAARELAPLATSLDLAMQRLQKSFVQQRTFVSDAAHELKTAVTIIKSSLQLLSYKERTAAEYREGLDLCLADCARMEELVLKMLTLARAEAEVPGKMLDAGPTNLGACLAETIQQLRPLAELKDIRLHVEDISDAMAALPKEDCITLTTNLVLNAIQHSGPASAVRVRVTPLASGISGFTVEDQGAGIAKDSLPFVFDRFYREDRSRARNTGGAGLGLAVCRAIVEGHGGTIEIQSEFGKGTLVVVTLPAFQSTEHVSLAAGNSA